MNHVPLRRTLLAIAVLMTVLAVSCGGSAPTDVTTSPVAAQPDQPVPRASPPAAEPPAVDEASSSTPDESPTPASDPVAPTTPAPVEPAVFEVPDGIVPTRIEIAAIGVDAPTIDLNLTGAEPEVPTNFADSGWYRQTRLPGEIGPAVIAGHIDSQSGPAVFAELDRLVPGDEIVVHDDAGEQRIFVVVDASQYPKGDLPASVFGFGEPVPELRLITCGGTFDQSTGHYRDNYVVFAQLKA